MLVQFRNSPERDIGSQLITDVCKEHYALWQKLFKLRGRLPTFSQFFASEGVFRHPKIGIVYLFDGKVRVAQWGLKLAEWFSEQLVHPTNAPAADDMITSFFGVIEDVALNKEPIQTTINGKLAKKGAMFEGVFLPVDEITNVGTTIFIAIEEIPLTTREGIDAAILQMNVSAR